MGFTSIQGQITQMTVHETGGNTVTFQIANVDSITYDTTTIAICGANFTDSRDGEVYATVSIGNQCWMAENLRYNASGSWLNPANPSTIYGRLYDWNTLMNGALSSSANPSGVQGICPSGWHLPSDSEWNELEIALGMSAADTANTGQRGTHGTGMKSTTGFSGNGTNASGFNAFPAGYQFSFNFYDLGVNAHIWSATEFSNNTMVWYRMLWSVNTGVSRSPQDKMSAHSCRCVKD